MKAGARRLADGPPCHRDAGVLGRRKVGPNGGDASHFSGAVGRFGAGLGARAYVRASEADQVRRPLRGGEISMMIEAVMDRVLLPVLGRQQGLSKDAPRTRAS